MNCIKKGLILLIGMICSSLCFAEQISFQIIQHNNSVEKVTEEALVVEDALLSTFFDKGYIVTNSEALLSNSVKNDCNLWKTGMEEAINGSSDYFVQIILHFTEKDNGSVMQKNMILEKVDYSFSLTENGNIKSEGTLICNLQVCDSSDLTIISSSIIDEIVKVLNA